MFCPEVLNSSAVEAFWSFFWHASNMAPQNAVVQLFSAYQRDSNFDFGNLSALIRKIFHELGNLESIFVKCDSDM